MNPAAFGIGQLDPASPDGQVFQQSLRFYSRGLDRQIDERALPIDRRVIFGQSRQRAQVLHVAEAHVGQALEFAEPPNDFEIRLHNINERPVGAIGREGDAIEAEPRADLQHLFSTENVAVESVIPTAYGVRVSRGRVCERGRPEA